jgi:cob(I)alamin adenosyltransferase
MQNELKIYTKTGDKGETALIGGIRVPKNHIRIEAYGSLDELNSFVGYLRDQLNDEHIREVLLTIQEKLFVAESILATDSNALINRSLPQLHHNDVKLLEDEIDAMNAHLPALSNFILPGGHAWVSLSHICRTVCRRSERQIISIAQNEPINEVLLRFINRLSDYFFVLSRELAFINKTADLLWKPTV